MGRPSITKVASWWLFATLEDNFWEWFFRSYDMGVPHVDPDGRKDKIKPRYLKQLSETPGPLQQRAIRAIDGYRRLFYSKQPVEESGSEAEKLWALERNESANRYLGMEKEWGGAATPENLKLSKRLEEIADSLDMSLEDFALDISGFGGISEIVNEVEFSFDDGRMVVWGTARFDDYEEDGSQPLWQEDEDYPEPEKFPDEPDPDDDSEFYGKPKKKKSLKKIKKGLDTIKREIYFDDEGNLQVENDLFFLTPDARGQGYGTKALMSQVASLRRIKGNNPTVKCFAARRPSPDNFPSLEDNWDPDNPTIAKTEINGYMTWPILGFNARLPQSLHERLPDNLKTGDEMMVSDLMQTPEGRSWWSHFGRGTKMSITPKTNTLLDRYAVEKAKRNNQSVGGYFKYASKATQSTGIENAPQLDKQDYEILFAMWDELGRQQKSS
jgi:GNAT superfamily N-acetyltransferase